MQMTTSAAIPDRVTLKDGTRIPLRPIRPDDKPRLQAAFDRLSRESRYRRFFSPKDRLTDAELAYLTEVDHHDHEAIIALDPQGAEGIGVARYVRSSADPKLAEVAVTVADDWQGRGVGTAVLSALTDRARAEGIERFSALVQTANRPMVELLDHLGTIRSRRPDGGAVEFEVELPERDVGRALREAMRAAAKGQLSLLSGHLSLILGRPVDVEWEGWPQLPRVRRRADQP